MMTNLEKSILEEQLIAFLRFLEINEFIVFENFTKDDVTREDLINSIVFNFIMDTYGDII